MKRHAESRQARRKPVREAYARAVDDAAKEKSRRHLENYPPRAEVPISLGHWRSPGQEAYDNTYDVEFEPTPCPSSPVWRVPIMADAPTRFVANARAYDGERFRTFDMRAVQWVCTIGATRLRWWNWEPVQPEGDPEAAAYRAANGAFQMMIRLTPHVEMVAKLDPYGRTFPWSEPGQPFPLPGDVALRYWRESLDLLGTWLGLVRARYTVPSKDSRVEERVGDARRP